MIDTDTGKILNAPRAYQYMGPVLTEVKDFTQEQKEAYDILGESFVESGFFPDLKSGDVGILRQIASIFPRASYDSYPFPYSRAPKRMGGKGEISGIQTSITTGRKFFVDEAATEAMGLAMPGDTSESKLTSTTATLSVKGTGYGHGKITHKNLMSADIPDARIDGITGLDKEDLDVTKKLVDGTHKARNLWGKEGDYKFEPGRYFVGAFPLKRIVTEDDPPVTVDIPSKPDEEFRKRYPLLVGENHPHVLIHLNWSKYTCMDITVGLDRTDSAAEAFDLLVSSFREIEQELKYHPYLAFDRDFEQMDDKDFLVNYLAHFFVNKMNQMHIEAQILEKLGLYLGNRNSQNYGLGGHIDFDGTGQEEGWMSEWKRDKEQLCSFYGNIFEKLDDKLIKDILKTVANKFGIDKRTKMNDRRRNIFNHICAEARMDDNKILNWGIPLLSR